MTSWAACCPEFPKDWLDLLGRWQAGQSSGYIRTARKRVMQMQSTVAREVRGGDDPTGAFDEENLFEDLAKFPADAGIGEERIAEQLGRLRFSTDEAKTVVASEDDSDSGF